MPSVIIIGNRFYFQIEKGPLTPKELTKLYTWRGKLSEKERQGFDYLSSNCVMGKQFVDETPYSRFSAMLQLAHRMRGFK